MNKKPAGLYGPNGEFRSWQELIDSGDLIVKDNEIKRLRFWSSQSYDFVIEDGIKKILKSAFYSGTKIKNITLPSTMGKINKNIFSHCTQLENIFVPEDNKKLLSDDGILFSKDKTVLIAFPAGKLQTSYTIPDTVIKVAEEAFAHTCYLETVDLNNIEVIEKYAFLLSGITEIDIYDSVKTIAYGAFYNCTRLMRAYIGKGVSFIGDSAFNCCVSLLKIDVSLLNIHYSSIDGVLFKKHESGKLSLMKYPEGKIETSYKIPESTTEIESFSFSRALSLCEVIMPDSVTEIGNCVFDYCCNLNSVSFSKNLTAIGNYAFRSSKLQRVILNEGLKSVGQGAFSYCRDLISIVIPKSLKKFGEETFSETTQTFKAIYYKGSENEWNSIEGIESLCTKKRVKVVTDVI